MEVQRRATNTGGIFECMDYSCYYPILEVQQFEHVGAIFRLLGRFLWRTSVWIVDIHTYFFFSFFAGLLVWLRIYS